MKKLLFVVLFSQLLLACSGGVSSSISDQDQKRLTGVNEGISLEAQRPSQAHPRLEPIKEPGQAPTDESLQPPQDGIDIHNPIITFVDRTRTLKVNMDYYIVRNGKGQSYPLYIEGRFEDFTQPIELLNPDSNKHIVKGYAFCKDANASEDRCEYIIVDLYFPSLTGGYHKVQLEQFFGRNLEVADAVEPIAEPTAKPPVGPEQTPASSVHNHDEDDDVAPHIVSPTTDEAVHVQDPSVTTAQPTPVSEQSAQLVPQAEELAEDAGIPKLVGDRETDFPRNPKFYKDFIIPSFTEEVPETPYQEQKERQESQATTVSPTPTPTPTPTPVSVAPSEPDASSDTESEEALAEAEVVRDAVQIDDVEGQAVDITTAYDQFVGEEEQLQNYFQTIGIELGIDEQQAQGHYADTRYERGQKRAALVGAEIFLGNTGEHTGIVRKRRNDPDSYGTGLMIKTLIYFGQWVHENLNTYIRVHDISKNGGGRLSGHESHRNGLDADIRYIGITEGSGFNAEKNWRLMKAMYETGSVSTFFVGHQRRRQLCRYGRQNNLLDGNESFTKALYGVSGHTTHFHLRLKCTTLNRLICVKDPAFDRARPCS